VETVLACRQYLPPERAAQVSQLKASHEDRALAARLKGLTPQQFRVLQLIAEGKLNKQIADRLSITERTVKAHVSAIFERLGVRNRTQAGVLLRQLDVNDAAQAPIPVD
jgi:DNA-binding NarL/FixJ family response regulator